MNTFSMLILQQFGETADPLCSVNPSTQELMELIIIDNSKNFYVHKDTVLNQRLYQGLSEDLYIFLEDYFNYIDPGDEIDRYFDEHRDDMAITQLEKENV